jgi:hypothetical protein
MITTNHRTVVDKRKIKKKESKHIITEKSSNQKG